jgi:hypothetical protein
METLMSELTGMMMAATRGGIHPIVDAAMATTL